MTIPDDSSPRPAPPSAPPRGRWQVGLRTVVLLTATVAVWLTYALERRRITDLTTQIAALSRLARELVVDDPEKIAVVKQEELWYDHNRWDLHVPPGRRFRLCLATRAIEQDAFPKPAACAPLVSGRRVVALEQLRDGSAWRVDATSDGTRLMSVAEAKAWDPGTGSDGGGHFEVSEQFAGGQRVVLFRRRFMGPRDANGRASTPTGPTAGVMLWIEPDPGAAVPSGARSQR